MATTMHRRDDREEDLYNENIDSDHLFPIHDTETIALKDQNIREVISSSKNEYYRNRSLSIKNIPATATNEEVEVFLGEYRFKEIKLNTEAKEAFVALENGQDGETIVSELNQAKILDQVVTVEILPSDKMMCIAHLPAEFGEEDFKLLVAKHGPIDKSYLIYSEDSGESKGYGIVEYSLGSEKHRQIRAALDWKSIKGHNLHCDILDKSTAASFKNLHSRCLLIDNLPKDYKDNVNFREIFSRHVSPIYCQIVMREGEPLGYGIVEYSDGSDAEMSQQSLNGHAINDVPMRVTFCVPGVPAVSICTRLLTKMEQAAMSLKPSLLPDPIKPNSLVINHPLVKDISLHHPSLMSNFKQALSMLQQTYVSQMTTKSAKPGLLGPAPSVNQNPLMNPNMQLGLIILLAIQLQSRSHNKSNIGTLNMLTLIGQRFSSNMMNDKPSLLGDPVTAQANIILQNLMSQVPSGAYSVNGSSTEDSESSAPLLQSLALNSQNLNLNWLASLGQLTNCMHENSTSCEPPKPDNNANFGPRDQIGPGNRAPLLQPDIGLGGQGSRGSSQHPDMGLHVPGNRMPDSLLGPSNRHSSQSESGALGPNGRGYNGAGDYVQSNIGGARGGLLGAMPKPPEEPPNHSQNFVKNLQMLGSQRPQKRDFSSTLDSAPNNEMSKSGVSLLGEPPVDIMRKWNSLRDKLENGPTGPDYTSREPHRGGGLLPSPGTAGVYNGDRSQEPKKYSSHSRDKYQGSDSSNVYFDSSFNRNYFVPYFPYNVYNIYGQRDSRDDSAYESFSRGSTSSVFDYEHIPSPRGSYMSQSSAHYPKSSRIASDGGYDRRFDFDDSAFQHSEPDRYKGLVSKPGQYSTNMNFSSNSGSFGNNFSTPAPGPRQSSQGLLGHSPSNKTSSPSLLKTPIGQKRSYSHLLPKPEPSPESDYVGQHSQGIGGHYAENYVHKRQKFNNDSIMSRFTAGLY